MPQSGMAQMSYYHATLCLHGPIVLTSDEKRGLTAAVEVGERQVPVGTKQKIAALLKKQPPKGEQGVILWPRTDRNGILGSGTQLALYKSVSELGREPGLHALGELVKIDRDNALLQLQIHVNEKQGSLQKPYRLPLVAALELLESLPELGSGVEVWGEFKPRTGRLVATRAQAVPLPPKRVVASKAT